MSFNFEQRIQNPNNTQQREGQSEAASNISDSSNQQHTNDRPSAPNSSTVTNTLNVNNEQHQNPSLFSASTSTRANVAFDSTGAPPV